MFRIQSIKELENELLKDSGLDDMHVFSLSEFSKIWQNNQELDKILSADEVKRDVSVFARYLIRVYVGWPVHNDLVKREVLNYLIKVYKSAHDMKAGELEDILKKAIEYIPDNHLQICFTKAKSKRNYKDVGNNFAGKQPIKTELRNDGIAIIGFKSMLKTDEFNDIILDFEENILPKSKALIVDLRGNSGGNSFYSDRFAFFLCGKYVDSTKEIYVRTTPEAKKVQQQWKPNASWTDKPVSEKLQLLMKGTEYKIDKKHAYIRPIYILIDAHTGSSAEMFLLRMSHHPGVTVIGDNSCGMEVYGDLAHGFLANSKISFSFGMKYWVLEYDNFEMNGYKPNIKCDDGVDAMDVAVAEYNKPNKNNLFRFLFAKRK